MARRKGSGGGRGKPPEKPPGKEKLGDRLTRYAMYGQMYNDRGSNMTMGQRAGGAVFNALEQGTLGRMGMLGGAISAGIHSKKPGGATEGGSGVDTQTIPFQQIKGDDIVSAINQSTRQVVSGLNAVNTTMGRGLNSLRDGIQAQSQALNSIVGANEDVAIQMREMMEALNKMGYDRGGSNGNMNAMPMGNASSIGSSQDATRQNGDGLLQDILEGALMSGMSSLMTKMLPGILSRIGPIAIAAASTAAVAAAGYAIDAGLGALGVGGNKLDTKKDTENWEKMNWWQKLESGTARTIENVGGIIAPNMANEAAANRISAESAYFDEQEGKTKNPNKTRAEAITSTTELTNQEIDELFKLAPQNLDDASLMALAAKKFPGRKYNTLKARIKLLHQLVQPPGPQSGLNTNKGVQVASLDPSIGLSSGSYLANRQAEKDNTSESKLKAQEATAEEAASKNITQSITVNAKDLFYKADKITFNTDTLEFKVGASSATSGSSGSLSGFSGSGSGPGGNNNFSGPVSGTTAQVLATIKKRESGGNYQAKNPNSSASGAYQFIDSTWQSLTKKYGVGTQYKTAGSAPPEIQDAVAKAYVDDILKQNNGDVSKVPNVWFTGNAEGKMSQKALAANGGLTAQQYQANWMNDFNKIAGSQVPSATDATPTSSGSTGGEGLQGPDTSTGSGSTGGAGLQGPDVSSGQSSAPSGGAAAPSSTPNATPVPSSGGGGGGSLNAFLDPSKRGTDHASGLKSDFASKLQPFLQAAKGAGFDLKIGSGYRSVERQKQLFAAAVQKYGSVAAARKWVAPPGKSNHNGGRAVDLWLNGKALTSNSKATQWAHANAGKYGLYFRMAHEPWHIEPTKGGAQTADASPVDTSATGPSGGGMESESSGGGGATPVASAGEGMSGAGMGGAMGTNPISGMMGALGGGANPLSSMMGMLGGGGSPFGIVGNLMGTVLGALSSSTSMSAATQKSGPVTANIINNAKHGSDSTGTNFPDPKSPLPAIDSMFARLFDGSSMFG